MATEIDELVTKLSYEDNSKALEEADARVIALDKSQQQLVATTDDLSDEQLKLAQQLQKSKERTDGLKTEQKQLQKAMKAAGGGTDRQKKSLKDLNLAIEGSDLRTKKLATQSARLGLEKRKVSARTKELTKDQRKLARAVKDATREVKVETSALGKFGQRVATIASGVLIRDFAQDIIGAFANAARAIGALVPEFTSLADSIGKTSAALGVSSDDLQRLRFAGERSGVAMDAMDKALQTLTKGFENARQKGTGPVADAFDQLNLKIRDFENIGTEEKVRRIADAMQGVGDPTRKSALAMALFGAKNKEMAVFLAGGAKGIKDLGDEAERLGGVIDSTAIVAAEGLADTFFNLETFSGGLVNSLSASLSPIVAKVSEGMLTWIDANQDLIDQGLDTAGIALSEVFQIIANALRDIPMETFVKMATNVADIFATLLSLFAENEDEAEGVGGAFFEIAGAMFGMITAAFKIITALNKLAAKLPVLPGTLQVVVKWTVLVSKALVFFIGILGDLLSMLDPVIDAVDDFVDIVKDALNPLDSLRSRFSAASFGALNLAKSTATLNDELTGTRSAALNAVNALQALANQKSTKDFGLTKGEADAQDASEKTRDKANKAKDKRANVVLEDAGNLSQDQLRALVADTSLSTKTREKASKALRKSERKKSKGGKGSKRDESEVVKLIKEQIKARAKEAGERAGARAVRGGLTDTTEIRRIELERRKEVSEQLTTRFETTGELPAGIRSDIKQLSATPGIDQVGGRVAPPVITITENKFETTVEINTTVEQSGATARQIAAANVQAFKGISKTDIGDAIRNSQTQERR